MKGELGQECNRTACDVTPALFFNTSTKAHYCAGCARKINSFCETPICTRVSNTEPILVDF